MHTNNLNVIVADRQPPSEAIVYCVSGIKPTVISRAEFGVVLLGEDRHFKFDVQINHHRS